MPRFKFSKVISGDKYPWTFWFSLILSDFMLGASTGVPTHDKVMRESPDGQGKSGLKGPPGLPERLPQNQNLSVLLFYDFYNSSDINGGLSLTTFL